MSKVKIRATQDDFENTGQDRGDFALPPKGLYVLTLQELNPGYSKDDDGKADRKRPRLEAVWKITGVGRENEKPEESYGNVWDYISFSESSGWKRADFLYALGLVDEKPDDDVEFEIDTEEVIGTEILARLRHDKRGDEPRAKIASMFPLTDADTEDAFGGGGGDDEDSEDVFGSVDEEGGGEELSREEELAELSLKELGGVAKELDIDPKEHIVKFSRGANKGKINEDKTRDAVIAAILEAEGDVDGGEGEEDPF